MTYEVEDPAALEAGRFLLVYERNGNRDANSRIGTEAVEVDVQQGVRHGIKLDVARQHLMAFTVQRNLENLAEESRATGFPNEFAGIH